MTDVSQKISPSFSRRRFAAVFATACVAASAFLAGGRRDASAPNRRAGDKASRSPSRGAPKLDAPIRTFDDWKRLNRSEAPRRIVCDGPGALRLASYLRVAERVVAVEQIEKTKTIVAPYRLANSRYGELPVFGEGHGRDNVEFLLSLKPLPDAIFRSDSPGVGLDPKALQDRTGIPVVAAPLGDFNRDPTDFEAALRLFGDVLNERERADEVLAFVDSQIEELQEIMKDAPVGERPSVFLGGLSYRGARGVDSTTTDYPPFEWLGLRNPAAELKTVGLGAAQTTVSPEQIVVWNPDFIFLDLGTLDALGANGWKELTTNPIYRNVAAVREGRVFGVYPNNSYNSNVEATLINAWFIGKTVRPELFSDVDFGAKADEISRFMLGETFRDKTPSRYDSFLYRRIPGFPSIETTNKTPTLN